MTRAGELGTWAARALRQFLSRDVVVLDGSTLGLDLLPYLDRVARLLVIDAICAGHVAPACATPAECSRRRCVVAWGILHHQRVGGLSVSMAGEPLAGAGFSVGFLPLQWGFSDHGRRAPAERFSAQGDASLAGTVAHRAPSR